MMTINLPYNQETVRPVTNSKVVSCGQNIDPMRECALMKKWWEKKRDENYFNE